MKYLCSKNVKEILTTLILIGSISILLATPQGEYVYYGVVPERIYRYLPVEQTDLSKGWYIDPATLGKTGYVSIVALEDNTRIQVYTVPDKKLVSEFLLNAMEKRYVPLPNGTMFKVVSNKLVSVLLMSPPPKGGVPGIDATEAVMATGFYPSTNGAYTGKEFVILASQGFLGFGYVIFAVEDAEVTITAEGGSMQTFMMKANTYKELQLDPFKVYKIVSTGNIMVQSGFTAYAAVEAQISKSFFIPSAEGGFVGRRFYSRTLRTFDAKEENEFIISALEDAKVTVWDLTNQKTITELKVKAGETARGKFTVGTGTTGGALAFDSDKPITVQFLHSGSISRSYGISYGVGLTYMSIRPNEEVPFVLPTNSTIYAYLFSCEEANVYIDDVGMTIRPDEPFIINTPGIHKIRSNKNLVLLLLHYPLIPPYQGIAEFSVPIPCVQTVSITPGVALSPLGGGPSIPISYIIAAVVFVAIIVVIVFLRKKK
ncbi:MAG: hypothetical protein QXR44_04180 [Thermoproteota archaeon]